MSSQLNPLIAARDVFSLAVRGKLNNIADKFHTADVRPCQDMLSATEK